MSIVPFLKWAGGKRWLVYYHKDIFNITYNRYIEPFVGSGSVFFHLMPKKAILSDKNENLINVYRAIKKDWAAVFSKLLEHNKEHSYDHYYRVRSFEYEDEFSKAAQFIYLNRTCWNGLYRVNERGIFNVPKGTKNTVILDTDDFEQISKCLKGIVLKNCDFENVISTSQRGDLLFIDPPYTANHNKNGFLKYNERIFSWEDQLRLSNCIKAAKKRGVKIILTNADHPSIRALYNETFSLRSVPRASLLSGKAEFRGKVNELIVLG